MSSEEKDRKERKESFKKDKLESLNQENSTKIRTLILLTMTPSKNGGWLLKCLLGGQTRGPEQH